VILAGQLPLLAGIFWAPVGAARERRTGIRDARDIRIANQRKDRVVKRRLADFNLAALCGVAVRRKNQSEEIELFLAQSGLSFSV